jgi:hypothetical protein
MASVALDIVWGTVLLLAAGVPAVVIGWKARARREANRPLPRAEELYRKWIRTGDPSDLDAYAKAQLEQEKEQD